MTALTVRTVCITGGIFRAEKFQLTDKKKRDSSLDPLSEEKRVFLEGTQLAR